MAIFIWDDNQNCDFCLLKIVTLFQEVDSSTLNKTNMVARNLTEVRIPLTPDTHTDSQDYLSIDPLDFLVQTNYSKPESPDQKALSVLKKIKTALGQRNVTKS